MWSLFYPLQRTRLKPTRGTCPTDPPGEPAGHGLAVGRPATFRRLVLLVLLLTLPKLAVSQTTDWHAERRSVDAQCTIELEQLAKKCSALELHEPAASTLGWMVPARTGALLLFVPQAGEPPLKAADPERIRQWRAALSRIRQQHAARLFELAGRAAAANDSSSAAVAYRLLWEVLRADSEHAEARRILGWRPSEGSLTAAPVTLDHVQLGWKARKYWRLSTPHYELLTNHSPKAALACGAEMERLHLLWRQAFFSYWCTPATLSAAWKGSAPLHPDRPRMKVVLFKHREEYAAQLGRSIPGVEVSLGYYDGEQRTAYFFAGDENVHPTWRHEGAHQLFQEYVRGSEKPGSRQNFWLVEGAALYLESLQPLGAENTAAVWSLGGWESDRLQFARYRALTGAFRLPLARAVALGREDVQQSPEIRKLYTQFAGLAHFLFDSPDPVRREAGISLLRKIYQDDDAPNDLAQATQTSLTVLDEAYLQWLKAADDDLLATPRAVRLKNISLAGCPITDRGLAGLPPSDDLIWLDLSRTAVTDDGLAILAKAPRLKQLFLDGAKITGKALSQIAERGELEELDLSNLPLQAADLAPLPRLKKLKILYLQNCPLDDSAVDTLRRLTSLEQLDLTGCKLSPAALQRLKAALPKAEVSG